MAKFILLRKHYIKAGLAVMMAGILGILAIIGPLKLKQAAISNWQPAKALLVDVQLTEENKGGTYFYGVKASYNFNLNGQPHEGHGVSIQTALDTDKSYHEETYQQLSKFNTGADAIDILVNPNDPTETVIFTDIRWWPIVGPIAGWGILALIGFGIFIYGAMIPNVVID
jgi:hypothetical protein